MHSLRRWDVHCHRQHELVPAVRRRDHFQPHKRVHVVQCLPPWHVHACRRERVLPTLPSRLLQPHLQQVCLQRMQPWILRSNHGEDLVPGMRCRKLHRYQCNRCMRILPRRQVFVARKLRVHNMRSRDLRCSQRADSMRNLLANVRGGQAMGASQMHFIHKQGVLRLQEDSVCIQLHEQRDVVPSKRLVRVHAMPFKWERPGALEPRVQLHDVPPADLR